MAAARIDPEIFQRFKVELARHGQSVQEVVQAAVEDYVKHGPRPAGSWKNDPQSLFPRFVPALTADRAGG